MPSLLLGGAALAIWLLERRRPLRQRVESPRRRQLRNAVIGAAGALTVSLIEQPIVAPLAARVARNGWGLVPRLRLPRAVETLVALALLDYTLYLWHVIVHRVPWLWRFHRVHHVDLDLDASTAIRFHFGELAISTPWRAAQVLLIGVRPEVLQRWQQLTLLSVIFHHSNLRLPGRIEWLLACAVVTPRLHGIHHSNRGEEMDSNWSSGLTIWDRLHGTLRTDVREEALTMGVEGVRDPDQVTLPRVLAMPFARAQAPERDVPASR
jgi:sterol desaturase/sphingolipid hydroxylase (fatty acid hydroxylase superfamily)